MDIKFRGKRIDNGEWVYGSHAMDSDGNEYIFTMWKKSKSCGCCDVCDCDYDSISCGGSGLQLVHPESVVQWTGYRDKNEVDIYYEAKARHTDSMETRTVKVLFDLQMGSLCLECEETNSRIFGGQVLFESLELLESV